MSDSGYETLALKSHAGDLEVADRLDLTFFLGGGGGGGGVCCLVGLFRGKNEDREGLVMYRR